MNQQQYRDQKRATRPQRPHRFGVQYEYPFQPWSEIRKHGYEAHEDGCLKRGSRIPYIARRMLALGFHGLFSGFAYSTARQYNALDDGTQ